MSNANRMTCVIVGCAVLLGAGGVQAQDWPQWRGPQRDGKAAGFTAPAAWPKTLTQKWKTPVGNGVATPALVGDKLYAFYRQGGNEVTRCLDASTGKEIWKDEYKAEEVTGAARSFPGTRSSPAVAEGKVATLGASGVLSCLDAASGKVVWRKDDFKSHPRFFTSSSPLIVGGLCVAQLGGDSKGGIAAYELASGNEKWKWTGDGTGYASPVLDTVAGSQEVVAETSGNIVGLGAADGKLLWQVPFKVRYNACTPIVDGPTIYYSGSGGGTHALKIEKQGDRLTAKNQWDNDQIAVQYDTPVLKNGSLFGITDRDQLFCLNAETGKTTWTAPAAGPAAAGAPPPAAKGKGKGGRGGMGGGGYGSVVDAGSVLFALTPRGQLIVFEPNAKEFKEIARYKVADGATYAYPIVSGNRVFVKDQDAVTLWTIE